MIRSLALVTLSFIFAHSAFSQEVYQAHTHVSLVSEQDAVAEGKEFWVALRLQMEQGWHVYWQNPGDSGLAPKIKWENPEGIKTGEIHWPYPKQINLGPLTSYGYENEVLLLVPVTATSLSAGRAGLHAHVTWLTCREECIPGRADLSLSLPVSAGPSFNTFKPSFDRAREELPVEWPAVNAEVIDEGQHWRLLIHHPLADGSRIVFYPFRNDVIEHAAPQLLHLIPGGNEIILTKSHIYPGGLSSLEGIAVKPSNWDKGTRLPAIVIHAPLGVGPAAETAGSTAPLLVVCFFAFLGGLILNLMPCVLPVLSIKVLRLVERHPDKATALRHALVYSLGVLVTVWALCLVLFTLKSAGKFVGWGFQFQSPVFVAVVAVVLFVLALNLFGVFEFAIPLTGLSGPQEGYQSSFISGVIATIFATPCTAPFMGTALTVALDQPNLIGFGIFTCLGLGLAFPFIVLSIFPSLLAFVPKPGPWMVHLKRFLGIVLMACVLWLVWVFALETGWKGISSFHKPGTGIEWQVFSPSALDDALQSGHGVFLDFTAAWCINCQVNDILVLQDPKLVKAFRDQGIKAFKADWTTYNPVITHELASLGRHSIPVYVYYRPGSKTAIILPQVITPAMIIDKIQDGNASRK